MSIEVIAAVSRTKTIEVKIKSSTWQEYIIY
jgi:hypothetical protein